VRDDPFAPSTQRLLVTQKRRVNEGWPRDLLSAKVSGFRLDYLANNLYRVEPGYVFPVLATLGSHTAIRIRVCAVK
jgi:hypothetical protein